MKKYAVVIDCSPSEQIGDDDNTIFCLGFLFSLYSTLSFNLVGDRFPDVRQRLRLRKFSGASDKYKGDLIEHLRALNKSGHVMAGCSIVNQRFIKREGLRVWTKAHGSIPSPSSFSKKGKPRVLLREYRVGNQTRAPFQVLVDELAILGWLTLELGLLHKMLVEINQSIVTLDILTDRLPNDQGPDGANKAELLKGMLQRLSAQTIDLVGIPDTADHHQRDLLVDNIAGLGRTWSNKHVSFPPDVMKFTKINLPRHR